jgi:hypothetical protein
MKFDPQRAEANNRRGERDFVTLRVERVGIGTVIAALTWASALRQHLVRDLVRGLSVGPSGA